MHFAGGREAGEAAIGAGDDVLAPDDLGKPPDALGDRLGMLDEVRAVRDDAGDQQLAVRQLRLLPRPPLVLVLVPGVAGLEGIGAGVDAEQNVGDVLQLQAVHALPHIDAVTGAIAHPLGVSNAAQGHRRIPSCHGIPRAPRRAALPSSADRGAHPTCRLVAIAAQEFTHWAARLDAGQLVFGWRCLPSVCRSHHSLPLLVTAASGYWLPKNVDHLLSF